MTNFSYFHVLASLRSLASGALCAHARLLNSLKSQVWFVHMHSAMIMGCFQEVEKGIEDEASGKKPRKRTVRQMEYCYEADLEGAAWLIL